MNRLIGALDRKKVTKSEEFVLNAVSCATNLLFYDAPGKTDMFETKIRIRIFKSVRMYVLETTNEEL